MQAITRRELAARWGRTVGTLANWAWLGKGPRPVGRFDRSVVYDLADVEAFEAENNLTRD